MSGGRPRSGGARGRAVQGVMADPDAQAILRELGGPLPDDASAFLGRLALLYGVPFNDLVPDARMLPQESIRFFFLDQNWLDALLDGALSVVAGLDSQHATSVGLRRGDVQSATSATARAERGRRRARRQALPSSAPSTLTTPSAPSAAPAPVWTGFLLRSAAVSDWPGLRVMAFADDDGRQPLALLRLDRPSPSVLLAIFDGIAARVDLAEPPQSLHFGVQEDVKDATKVDVPLRSLGAAGHVTYQLAEQIPDQDVLVHFRDDRRRVVDVARLRDDLGAALAAQYGGPPPTPLGPAAFALELDAGAPTQPFTRRAVGGSR